MPTTYRIGVIGHTGRGDYGHGIDVVWKEIPNAKIVAVADADPNGLAAAAQAAVGRAGVSRLSARCSIKVKPDIVGDLPAVDRSASRHGAWRRPSAASTCIWKSRSAARCAEADEMIAACERTHARLALAHQTRYSPRLEVVKQLIADGKLGRVLEYRGRGKEDPRGGGEDLWVLGSHIMDLIRMFGGEPQWCFASVMQNGKPVTAADVKPKAPKASAPWPATRCRRCTACRRARRRTLDRTATRPAKCGRFGLQIFGSAGVIEILTGYLPSVQYPGRSRVVARPQQGRWQEVTSAGVGKPEPLIRR